MAPEATNYNYRAGLLLLDQNPAAAITDLDQAIQKSPKLAAAFTNRCYAFVLTKAAAKALIDCNRALQLDPNSGPTFANKARALLGTGDATGALAAAQDSVRIIPNDTYAASIRGEVFRVLGRKDEARRDYSHALAIGNDDEAQAIALAGLKLLGVDVDAANKLADSCEGPLGDQTLSACDRAIASGVFDSKRVARLHWLRGMAHADRDELGPAIADLDEAIRLNPDDARVFNARGHVHVLRDERDLALQDMNAAIRLSPSFAEAFAQRGAFYSDMRTDEGREHALADFGEAIRLDPSDTYSIFGRSRVYFVMGDDDLANDGFKLLQGLSVSDFVRQNIAKALPELTLTDNPKPVDGQTHAKAVASFSRADGKLKCRDFDPAATDFKQAIALDPYYAVAYAGRAAAYQAKGYYLLAIADYSQALRRDPNVQSALAGRASVFAEIGDIAAAKADYQTLIARATNSDMRATAQAYLADPSSYRKTEPGPLPAACSGDAQTSAAPAAATEKDAQDCNDLSGDPAIAACDQAIASGKFAGTSLSRLLADRCVEWQRKKEFDRALDDCNRAIQVDPTYAGAFADRGFLHFARHDFDQAVNDAHESTRLSGSYAWGYFVSGAANTGRARYDDAISDFSEAIRLNPKYAAALQNRAQLYVHKQDYAHAKADYDAVLALNPDPNTRTVIEEILKELEKSP